MMRLDGSERMGEGSPVNILLVDDQPAKLVSYEVVLADLGENLIKATSGREALDLLLRTEIAVVLMDVSMPEMDGFELAALIHQHPRFQRMAIIFVSGVRITELDRLKGYEVGAIDFLPVPVIPEILRAKVAAFAELYRKSRALEELNRELERRVEERTAALEASTERLRESEKRLRMSLRTERAARVLAEDALAARDEFLSVAAHELKTPLTGLRASAQILTRRLGKGTIEAPPWLANGLRTIDEQSARLTRLLALLLDVSRLDQSKVAIERVATDLTALVGQVVSGFRARGTRHEIALRAEKGMVAAVDPVSIEQVLSNLLDNAIKYSPDGGRIEVELGRAEGEQVRLAVRDHGLGIAPEKRAAIFERFYQAHAAEHRSGLGLGLYITHQIVSQHDGTIFAEFPAEGGTRFVVLLPVAAPVAAAND
ncbi:MAG TPA: ATP-binding protein [Ktedonobacterales bacterium]|nr:ATP-binding protein [Ktedonobacterales bacterium]